MDRCVIRLVGGSADGREIRELLIEEMGLKL